MRQKRRDWRLAALVGTAVAIAIIGYLVTLRPAGVASVPAQAAEPFAGLRADPAVQASRLEEAPQADRPADADALLALLRPAEKLIAAGRHDAAIAELNRVQAQVKDLPEAYFHVAGALLGKQDYATARDFYQAAIDRDPTFADAYFGFAVASEGLDDLPAALGGMRSFLHTARNPDPYRLKIAQARAAIWEWEARLGRGSWGASRGVPPGFTAAELRRDGRGVGTKMPVAGSADAQGLSRYEIRTGERIEMFKP